MQQKGIEARLEREQATLQQLMTELSHKRANIEQDLTRLNAELQKMNASQDSYRELESKREKLIQRLRTAQALLQTGDRAKTEADERHAKKAIILALKQYDSPVPQVSVAKPSAPAQPVAAAQASAPQAQAKPAAPNLSQAPASPPVQPSQAPQAQAKPAAPNLSQAPASPPVQPVPAPQAPANPAEAQNLGSQAPASQPVQQRPGAQPQANPAAPQPPASPAPSQPETRQTRLANNQPISYQMNDQGDLLTVKAEGQTLSPKNRFVSLMTLIQALLKRAEFQQNFTIEKGSTPVAIDDTLRVLFTHDPNYGGNIHINGLSKEQVEEKVNKIKQELRTDKSLKRKLTETNQRVDQLIEEQSRQQRPRHS